MANQYLLLLYTLFGLIIFLAGFMAGFAVKRKYRYWMILSQNRGEAIVRRVIVSSFLPQNYHLLNNITIPFQNGTTQIDHILVATKGVFVIETKNYSGWIFGDESSKQWTQVIYRAKSKFQNPIHQNNLHVKAIQELLDFLPKEQIHSIVVFAGSAVFKSPIPKGVVYQNQLVSHINTFQDAVISGNRLEFCVGRLECKRYEVTKKTDLEHRAYLAKKHGDS
jgi:hypothetical protein